MYNVSWKRKIYFRIVFCVRKFSLDFNTPTMRLCWMLNELCVANHNIHFGHIIPVCKNWFINGVTHLFLREYIVCSLSTSFLLLISSSILCEGRIINWCRYWSGAIRIRGILFSFLRNLLQWLWDGIWENPNRLTWSDKNKIKSLMFLTNARQQLFGKYTLHTKSIQQH